MHDPAPSQATVGGKSCAAAQQPERVGDLLAPTWGDLAEQLPARRAAIAARYRLMAARYASGDQPEEIAA